MATWLFPPFGCCESCCCGLLGTGFVWTQVFISPRWTPRSRIAGSVFSPLRNFCLPSTHPTLHSHPLRVSSALSPVAALSHGHIAPLPVLPGRGLNALFGQRSLASPRHSPPPAPRVLTPQVLAPSQVWSSPHK
ncbi:hypothetical protein mRhiFer1_008602 [Rhinolophus ferrumequinum]|uniref:Uncharacterized protein n=1 Tax=Rhinolophus ferrumequinum TaxID=59479 RepID=A0A7J7U0X2_RHIFE|nr:hypothetical protein mRhiFer1_008602 [Rhinolophus ferrumequinum]